MDEKTMNAVATSLALLQIQVNAVLTLFQAHPTVAVKEQFQQLVDEGVKVAGLETMKRMKDRLRDGIVQQDLKDLGLEKLWGN